MKTVMKMVWLAGLCAVWGVWAEAAQAGEHRYYQNGGYGDLFRQYYSGPVGGYEAGMYPSPMPVPEYVGHTYYTYPPLSPHLMMRRHSSWYPLKRTHVWYH